MSLRDGAAVALNQAARDPSGFLGDQAGAFIPGRIMMSLTTIPACRLNPNAARQLAEKAAKTDHAARNAARLEKIADVPGNAPPCGIAKKADCFWRAMRDATGDPAFDKLLNGPGVASWGDAFKYMAKYFGGKVPGVQDLQAHVLGLPKKRSLDDILTKDLAKKGSEGIVFARFQNGENHVLMGANLTGSASLFDDQKQFFEAELSQKTVEQAYGDRVAQWRFYKTR